MNVLSWEQITTTLEATGRPRPNGQPLTELPLVIIVGLTGVGKSTVITLLAETNLKCALLPNRRKLTDEIIITALQRAAGQPPHSITDRVERFNYTARYRAIHPGGMAHALSRLAVDPVNAASLLIFDGLRGLDEVKHATLYFPQARFVVLEAADMIRLNRLFNRGDTFDTTTVQSGSIHDHINTALMKVPGLEAIFNKAQVRQLAASAEASRLSIAELLQKVSIIVEERRNYDPDAARQHLLDTLPAGRVLVVDTAAYPAQAVANQVADWLIP